MTDLIEFITDVIAVALLIAVCVALVAGVVLLAWGYAVMRLAGVAG